MVKQLLAFDEAILLGLRRLHVPAITRLMRIFTRIGDTSSWVLLGLVLLAAGGSARRSGVLLAAAALFATLLSQTLKRLCKRPRPSSRIGGFYALAENPDAFSFPSGHTCAAFAVAIALAGRDWLGPLQFSLAFAIGISRVYLGAHYPLDVAVGATLGVIAGSVVRLLV